MTLTPAKHRPYSLKTFARRGGRALSASQRRLIAAKLPDLRIKLPAGDSTETLCDPACLFARAHDIWLEIGFGGGEHSAGQALKHSDIGYIASEVFLDGIAKCLSKIEAKGIQNIRLWDDDARILIEALKPASIARCFILFPDPWPKVRHQKRRLIQPDFLTELGRIIKPGGKVRFATDVRSYADQALTQFLQSGHFNWCAANSDDWRMPPSDHVTTRYETKNMGDIKPVYFDFLRH